jgi:uncharacterized alkaline shock family protein YloU
MRCNSSEAGDVAEPAPQDDDPGGRGTLTVRHRAVEHLAARAAMETEGVQHFRRGIDKLTGREVPKTDVLLSGDHVRASIEIAVEWGRSLAGTAEAVQARITEVLSTMSGLTVDGVDVHVVGVVPAASATQRTLQ